MIVESILGIVSGIGGTALTSWLNSKAQRQKNEHEIAMAKVDHEMMIAEAKINMARTEAELIKDIETADAKSFETSLKIGNVKAISDDLIEKLFEGKFTKWMGVILVFILGLVEAVRKSIRPGITIVLLYITSYLTVRSIGVLSSSESFLSPAQVNEIIGSIIYLTFTVVGWWFGDRRIAKFSDRLNDGNFRKK